MNRCGKNDIIYYSELNKMKLMDKLHKFCVE